MIIFCNYHVNRTNFKAVYNKTCLNFIPMRTSGHTSLSGILGGQMGGNIYIYIYIYIYIV